jgi:LPS-assembly protein
MYRLIIIFSLFIVALVAKNFELLSNKADTVGDITTAEGNVVVQGPNYYIQADKAVYNKKTEVMELHGNVNTVKDSSVYTISDYSKINMKTECSTSTPFFLLNDDSGIWFNSKHAESEKNIFTIYNSTVSSCNTQDPVWSISFKEGEFDRDDQWLKIYHPTFYVGSMPVGYLPFFAFPTSDKRRSGLLLPKFAVSTSEGLGYIQPIYFAPQDDWDLELTPQIRGKRGQGLYANYRFVGDKTIGHFTTGYFENSDNWVAENNLANSNVHGYEFELEKSKFMSIYPNHEDGLYMNIKHYNDVDYIYLRDFDTHSADTIANSKINYYFKTEDFYYGAYFVHQSDTRTSANNDETMQTLPSLQFHKFSQNIFINNLLYNIDYKVKNHSRKSGVNAIEKQVLLPISYYKTLFDGFLTLELSENIFMADIEYHNFAGTAYDDAEFFRNYHRVGLSTNLIKKYDSFIHNFNLESVYTIPSYTKQNGDIYKLTNSDENLDFIAYDLQRENVSLNLSQYFYNLDGDTKFRHMASQTLFFDGGTDKFADLLNDMTYYISDYLTLSHNQKYSHESGTFPYLATTISYVEEDNINASISHTNEESSATSTGREYVILDLTKQLDYKYDLLARVEYDIKDEYKKKQELGISMTKSCWGYKIKYAQDIIPQNNDIGNKHDNKILFEINFIPMGGFVYSMQRN